MYEDETLRIIVSSVKDQNQLKKMIPQLVYRIFVGRLCVCGSDKITKINRRGIFTKILRLYILVIVIVYEM